MPSSKGSAVARRRRSSSSAASRTGVLWLAGTVVAPYLLRFAQNYALQKVQSLFVGSLMSMVSVGAMGFGGQMLMQAFGAPAADGLVGAAQRAALPWFSAAPPPPSPEMARRLAELEARGGASDALAQLAALAEHRTGIGLVVLASFLSYLHYLGAMEVRQRLSRRRQPPPTQPPPPPAGTATIGAQLLQQQPPHADTDDAQRQRLLRAVQLLHGRRPPPRADDHDEVLYYDVGGRVQRWLHDLYASDAFYTTPVEATATMLTRTPHPARLLVNVFLGLVLQLGSLVGLDASATTAESAAQLLSLTFYWEVFVYAVRLYGWGPVSAAITYVVGLLMGGDPTAKAFTRRRAY